MTDYYIFGIPSTAQIKKGIDRLNKVVKSIVTARKIAIKYIGTDPNTEVKIYEGTYVGFRDSNMVNRILYRSGSKEYWCDIIKDGYWDKWVYLNKDGTIRK